MRRDREKINRQQTIKGNEMIDTGRKTSYGSPADFFVRQGGCMNWISDKEKGLLCMMRRSF